MEKSKVGKILAEREPVQRNQLIDALSEVEAKELLKYIIGVLAKTKVSKNTP